MSNTDTNASAGKSCNGACSAASPGCKHGSTESQSIEVLRWPPLCEPSATSSGVEAIEARMATGDDQWFTPPRLVAALLGSESPAVAAVLGNPPLGGV